jgi:hypothetical protein
VFSIGKAWIYVVFGVVGIEPLVIIGGDADEAVLPGDVPEVEGFEVGVDQWFALVRAFEELELAPAFKLEAVEGALVVPEVDAAIVVVDLVLVKLSHVVIS